MSTYAYVALDPRGARARGELDGENADAVTDVLRQRGLIPLSVDLKRAAWNIEIKLLERIKARDMVVFSRQFATMIGSGMTVLRALAVLEQQTEKDKLREVLATVRTDVEGGASLSEALDKHPRVFNRLYVAMVHAGEIGGVLEGALSRAADQLEKDAELRRAVKSALVYPVVVIGFALIVLLALVAFLVPVFVGVLEDFGSELPFITKITVGLSDIVTGWWWAMILVLVATFFAVRQYVRTENGRRTKDRLMLKLPVKIGQIVQKVAIARWSRTLGTLVAAGVPLLQAIDITGRTSGNALIEDSMGDVSASVRRGGTIQAPLREATIFPPMVAHMVGVGEETGALDSMLDKIADFYEAEVAAAVKALTAILEPLLIIVVGAMVGFIVISMYLPLFSVYDSIK
ncbi:Type IV fimbrial assembly protein PilC [Patulibacter medicamentivorans]|uniref:Type IV fimbrial assembly protein PilC n=1 Tax=Patulibacter medicamentivorans TaxID=1097667 RepID=H0E2Z0_9ACTN|nr:type II secretion system F family protein [Patulibacter medicamentivorans]EHN11959.1 Type IV fimbrial assembly protein PilC [Patulibacter medicamentivorans]